MRNRLLVLPVGISLVAAAIAGSAGAATASAGQAGRPGARPPGSVSSTPATYFDSRVPAAPRHATAAESAAVRAMLRGIGSGARITYDPIFGTPRELLRYGGYLTGPARGSAVSVARAWLGAHRAAFGLSAAGVRGLVVSRDYTNPASRTQVITFTQVFGGLQAVEGGRLNVAVTRDGRILNFTGTPRPSAGLAARPRLSAASAVTAVARSAAPRTGYRAAVTGKTGMWTRFGAGPFGGPQYARAAAFPAAQSVRPAYEVIFTASTSNMMDVVVDAVTGKVLFRQSLTANDAIGNGGTAAPATVAATGPGGLVFLYYPGAPTSPNQVVARCSAASRPAPWVRAGATGTH
jgi:extracellular elastinolytic metalloproteinase